MIARFWRQPYPAYRNFQLVYTALTLNFLIPAISYLVAPVAALGFVHDFSGWIGMPYTACEDGHFWRFLAFSDVFTLGFICLLLQLNLRRWFPALLPLLVCKGSSVVGAAYVGLVQYHHPFFVLPVLLDSATVAAMWFFATRARRATAGAAADALVPRPRFAAAGREPAVVG